MLHDTFLDILWFCAIIVTLLGTLVVIKASYRYLRGCKASKPITVWPPHAENWLKITTTAVKHHSEWESETAPPEAIVEDTHPATQPVPVAPVSYVAQELPAETGSEPENEIIVCGNCGEEIRVGSMLINKLKEGGSQVIYQCEHCGEKVAIEDEPD